jgi:hypothetical protein
MAKSGASRKRRPQPNIATPGAQLPMPFVVPSPPRPVRGAKLKTISRFVMLFALMCLGAFWAGRTPMAAGPGQARRETDASVDLSDIREPKASVTGRSRAHGAKVRKQLGVARVQVTE